MILPCSASYSGPRLFHNNNLLMLNYTNGFIFEPGPNLPYAS